MPGWQQGHSTGRFFFRLRIKSFSAPGEEAILFPVTRGRCVHDLGLEVVLWVYETSSHRPRQRLCYRLWHRSTIHQGIRAASRPSRGVSTVCGAWLPTVKSAENSDTNSNVVIAWGGKGRAKESGLREFDHN